MIEIRSRPQTQAAIVFLHGFGGSSAATWGRFSEFLSVERELDGWDIFSLGYASSLRIDVPHVWAADPPLDLLSVSLRSALQVNPLARYRSLALITHSMGGLVAQHALLDQATAARVAYLFLFATPSGGLHKAVLGSALKRQFRDMRAGGRFITDLRQRWDDMYGRHTPFLLCVIAGERDEFVPASSSLSVFPDGVHRVAPGNHIEVVKPETRADRSIQIVLDALCRTACPVGAIDSARLAVERHEFAAAIKILLPRVNEIDEGALIQLALALEAVGRSGEALSVLETRFRAKGRPSTDAYGVLAGRIKRRWLVERSESDWLRARELYETALSISSSAGPLGSPTVDPDQAMYHAINIAFLDLMGAPPASSVPIAVKEMALRAREYGDSANKNHWTAATIGDSHSILGDLHSACLAYGQARDLASKPRDVESMYAHSVRIAERVHGVEGVKAVEKAYCVGDAPQCR